VLPSESLCYFLSVTAANLARQACRACVYPPSLLSSSKGLLKYLPPPLLPPPAAVPPPIRNRQHFKCNFCDQSSDRRGEQTDQVLHVPPYYTQLGDIRVLEKHVRKCTTPLTTGQIVSCYQNGVHVQEPGRCTRVLTYLT